MTFGPAVRSMWHLDPKIAYLNHGTVGATPIPVLKAQSALRERIERQPARFAFRELYESDPPRSEAQPLMRRAADRVGAFLGARGRDVVFVENTTSGVNAVLQSFPFDPGDTVVLTSLGYGSFPSMAHHVAAHRGLQVHTLPLPFPVESPEQIVAAFEVGLPDHATLVVLDLIASSSAVLLPVEPLIRLCRDRGIVVFVDGAHAPGHLDLNIESLGADFFIGNLHKWMWTPRSSAVLWSDPKWQEFLHPPVLSWGLGKGFVAEFDVVGTRDPTSHLCAPAALDLLASFGAEKVRAHNHALAVEAGALLAQEWGTEVLAPADCFAAMVPVRLPELGLSPATLHAFRDHLLDAHGIEVHLAMEGDLSWARVALQIYNDLDDVQRLADAVRSHGVLR